MCVFERKRIIEGLIKVSSLQNEKNLSFTYLRFDIGMNVVIWKGS